MGQIQNYKKKNDFNHTLLNIEDLELSTFEIKCNISYKKTVPLNLFEKYSIRLIMRAEEIQSDMNIEKISQLLHLDKNLIRENLENLEAIGMLNDIDSDNIVINRDENSEYLRYENKFRIERLKESYHLTNSEYNYKDNFIQKEFDKDKRNRDKKFKSVEILGEKESSKSVHLLNFSDNKFLIFSKSGINANSDLKFIKDNESIKISTASKAPQNTFCHYDEFLVLLRDRLKSSNNELVIIGSQDIEKGSLAIIPRNKDNDTYILSSSQSKHKRVFDIACEDFVWIGDTFYKREDRFVIEIQGRDTKKEIKEKLIEYFDNKILEIEPNYNLQEQKSIEKELHSIEQKINSLHFKTQKEIDAEIQKINTKKNRLYGLTNKSSQTRSKARQQIDNLEEENNQKELEQYTEYLKNRDKIMEFKNQVKTLEEEKKELINLNDKLAQLNSKKSKAISKRNREKIMILEKELENLKRLKI